MQSSNPQSCEVAVIGAGLSALVAAREFHRAGRDAHLFEKSRGLGGRMATRRLSEARFDHGCQFFTVRSESFAREVARWEQQNLVAPWFNRMDEQGQASLNPDCENTRYRVAEGMTALPKALGEGLPIHRQHTVSEVRWTGGHWHLAFAENEPTVTARALLSTAPVPQTLALLDGCGDDTVTQALEPLREVRYAPCFALMVLLDRQPVIGPSGFFAPREDPVVATLADNAAKGVSPRIGAISILSTDTFAAAHFDQDPDEVTAKLLAAAKPWLTGCEVLESSLRRWKYARPVESFSEPGWLLPSHRLAVAGDAFGGPPRLEQAFLSGRWVAGEALKMLSPD